jgi:uncharacterized protein with von Willebrand factor type A (vWA) domain
VLRLRYSRWDGSQAHYSIEAEEALDELSRYMMEGLDVGQSLDWMRQQGFELAGMEFRVMGLEDLIRELRRQAQELLARHNMDHSFDERRDRLDEILDQEQSAVQEQHGVESEHWNDLCERRDAPMARLSERIDRFADYEWTDPEAEAAFRELAESRDEMQSLEEFFARLRRGARADAQARGDEPDDSRPDGGQPRVARHGPARRDAR